MCIYGILLRGLTIIFTLLYFRLVGCVHRSSPRSVRLFWFRKNTWKRAVFSLRNAPPTFECNEVINGRFRHRPLHRNRCWPQKNKNQIIQNAPVYRSAVCVLRVLGVTFPGRKKHVDYNAHPSSVRVVRRVYGKYRPNDVDEANNRR